jgi:hypothetical protein
MGIQPTTAPRWELPRKLGLLDSTNIVVGTMIGSAIFLVPNTIAQNVPSVPLILAIWVLAGGRFGTSTSPFRSPRIVRPFLFLPARCRLPRSPHF